VLDTSFEDWEEEVGGDYLNVLFFDGVFEKIFGEKNSHGALSLADNPLLSLAVLFTDSSPPRSRLRTF
jgi:prepilin-type processing-associated H-X9-DG protein